MDLQHILTFLQIISIAVSLVVTIFGFSVKRELKRIDDLDVKVEKITKDRENCNNNCIKSLSNFRTEVYENFVQQAEFIRINSDVMKKLDKIMDILFEMKGRS